MKEIYDGGPAFPMSGFLSPMENSEALAYDNKPQSGMTMRDYFAGQALAGLASVFTNDAAVRKAFEIADAMIVARKLQR